MVTTMMHQHQNHGNPPPSSAAIGSIRSPPSHSHSHSHRLPSPSPLSLDAPSRIRLSDILPYDGTPMGPYIRAVDALSNSLMRHNAAVIELGPEDAALLRCALESARLYFRTRKAVEALIGDGRNSYDSVDYVATPGNTICLYALNIVLGALARLD
ncbi:UNVERIFIED_CONTAM: hypothetical protein Sindi_2022400 [Sesamum indicum]